MCYHLCSFIAVGGKGKRIMISAMNVGFLFM